MSSMPDKEATALTSQDQEISFATLLNEIAPAEAAEINVAEEAGVAFRFLYDAWVRQGRYVRGKPRRSVRQIKTWLGNENEVRSLETKLSGKTLFQFDDVRNLLGVILKHWQYDERGGRNEPHPFYADESALQLLTEEIFSHTSTGSTTGLRLPIRKRQERIKKDNRNTANELNYHDDTLDSKDAIEDFYRESDALITVSRERTFIGAEPASIMLDFQEMMDRLRAVDKLSNRFRALIWIVDSGQFEHNRRSQAAIHNMEFLATQFRALVLTDHPERDARASWFQERVVVFVGTLRPTIIDPHYAAADIDLPEPDFDKDWINPDRLFLDGSPDRWIDRLGRERSDTISQRTITVHRDVTELNPDIPAGLGKTDLRDLRFLLHAPLRRQMSPRVSEAETVRCVELPRPGDRWGDSFRLAHEVALLRLDRQMTPSLPYSALEGLRLLRDHRFAALKLREFCELTNYLTFGDRAH